MTRNGTATMAMCVVLWFAGCALPAMQQAAKTPVPSELEHAAQLKHEHKFDDAVKILDDLITSKHGTTEATEALFEKAMWFVDEDNPRRNFAQAIKLLETLTSEHPDYHRAHEAYAWISVLTMNIEMKKEIDRLNRNIEQLKNLDIRHEERRKK